MKGSTMQQSTAEFYPQTITETVFDVLPRIRESVNGVNFLGKHVPHKNLSELAPSEFVLGKIRAKMTSPALARLLHERAKKS